jgi:hypothetical protein
MLVALIDIFVIKLFSYDLKDHTFILQTPASLVIPPLGFIMVDTTRVLVRTVPSPTIKDSILFSHTFLFYIYFI